jgi:hypothetical protein
MGQQHGVGQDNLALVAGGGGCGQNRPGSEKNRRRLGFHGGEAGQGWAKGKEIKGEELRRGRCPTQPMEGGGRHGQRRAVCPVPGDEAPIATTRTTPSSPQSTNTK